MLKRILLLVMAAMLAAGAYSISYLRDIEAIAADYISQTVCTNVVILGRDQVEVEAKYLTAQQREIASSTVRDDVAETNVKIGPIRYTEYSLYRPGMGCSVLAGRSLEDVRAISLDHRVEKQSGSSPAGPVWPGVERNVPGINWEQLDTTIANTFTETTDDIEQAQNTRAVLVSYRGKLLAERYADGFDGDTPQRGMSMTKSATATLIGILVQQGHLDINALAPIDGWSELEDGRSRVTTHHLLKMTAGFDYQENTSGVEDLRNLLKTMLYATPDAPGFAAQTPLQGEPGNSWAYQTVHSVLLQQVLRNVIADDQQYFRFPQQQLFDKLGMQNSFFQAEADGTFIGGASMYASARDWMRLGLLYLDDGVHQGERILPEGWVKYATTASEPSLQTRAYGAQIWLNTPSPRQLFPGMPEDTYAFQGHFGQYVIVVPSLELVVVRMGMTYNGEQGFDKQALLQGIVAALPASQSQYRPAAH
jgi:CubicO group peptidase (beta-lactamase class C family)